MSIKLLFVYCNSVKMDLLSIIILLMCICVTKGDETTTMSARPYDTIVIGLGSSGVTAATTLATAGKRVLGLEAQDRIGGRVRTVPFGNGVVELGAEWIHGESPSRVYDLAKLHNISIIPQDLNVKMFRSDGSTVDSELINDLVMKCLTIVEEPVDKPEPLGDFVTARLMAYIQKSKPELLKDKDFIEQFLIFMNLLVNNYESSNDWNDVSAMTRYEELEGHQHMSWHRYGYKTFFEILLNRHNNGPGISTLETKLNQEVVKITWPKDTTGDVMVTCKDGVVYTANNVIITVSVGVLKERHANLFSPSLPQEKIDAINAIPIGVMDKIILSFPEPWWPRNLGFFGFLWKGDDRRAAEKDDYWVTRIFGASSPMGAGNALTLWTSGDVAKLVETLPEDVVKRKSVELLQRFLGANITIPKPDGIIRSTWYSNPFTRGSYSYDSHSVAASPNCRTILSRPLLDAAGQPRVLFAGEATDNLHFSTVHGASDTGYREAVRLLPKSKI